MTDPRNFSDYSLNDFLWDENFRRWALTPDPVSNTFWSKWQFQHPQKKLLIEDARAMILALVVKEPVLSDANIHACVKDTLANLGEPEVPSNTNKRKKKFI